MALAMQNRQRRRGAAAVETAMVLIPVLMLLFGIFEYGRFLLDRNVLDNAAREGCRYALANNNTDPAVTTSVQTIVNNVMGNQKNAYTNFTVTVSGTHNGVSTPVGQLAPGDQITVTVSGTYKLLNIVPLASIQPSFTMSSSVTMICEGGT
jgi:Flp pilus assembly protein TadG